MRYVVKDLNKTVSPVSGDTVVVVVKDLKEKIFSAEYLSQMLKLEADGIRVLLAAAPDKETFMFLAGAYSQNGKTTYVGFDFQPPEGFEENITIIPEGKTVSIAKKSTRKRPAKPKEIAKPVLKAPADMAEPVKKAAKAPEKKPDKIESADDAGDAPSKEEVKPDMPEGLVPHETEKQVLKSLSGSDLEAYNILHIKSEDVEFTWPTSILMWQILHNLEKCETEDDAREAIKAMRNGDKIAKAAEGHWKELIKIAQRKD